MARLSQLAEITNFPKDPVELFKSLLSRLNQPLITMNLATVDSEFGVLNRTVLYRGLVDNAITFVTEKNSRKYQNLQANAKVGITLLFPEVQTEDQDDRSVQTWQVRLIGATVVELGEDHLDKLWAEESVFAKIRSRICECGKPVDHAVLKQHHDRLLQAYESGADSLERTKTYTAFKLLPERWDFYKGQVNTVADRLQYRKRQTKSDHSEHDVEWEVIHVAT